jgi:hypothetical protein
MNKKLIKYLKRETRIYCRHVLVGGLSIIAFIVLAPLLILKSPLDVLARIGKDFK